jgi:hypothetical protein
MGDTAFSKPDQGGSLRRGGAGTHRPGFTGRYLVLFEPDSVDQARSILKDKAGVQALSARDVQGSPVGNENLMLEELGVAVLSAAPEQHQALVAAATDTSVPVKIVEEERMVFALPFALPPSMPRTGNGHARPLRLSSLPPPFPQSAPSLAPAAQAGGVSAEFLRGYAAAVENLLASTGAGAPSGVAPSELATATDAGTWGLTATGVLTSRFSGKGIKVAVLDTGFDLHHPDFAGRTVVTRSFVSGEAVQDGNGHGTHCIGVACGPRQATGSPRYGIAFGADIYVGKVLSNAGSGADGGILQGINWAVQQGCRVVSMSLGAPVEAGQSYSLVYQNAAARALQKGTLIIAAAGNESSRPDTIAPVGHPANCPSIVAVGAVDASLAVAWFSCGGVNADGGAVDVAGPGVDVYSSWPMPERYKVESGTSMATPHMAGIAALCAEETNLRGLELANQVLERSRRLFPSRDFGWGLVEAG